MENNTEECEKIAMIQRQTMYTYEEAREKLKQNNGNVICVIEEFMGIHKKEIKSSISVQQEIYKQIRMKMDHSIKQYNKKQADKIDKDIAIYFDNENNT